MAYIDLNLIPYSPDGSLMSGDPYALAKLNYQGTPQEWEYYSRGIDPKSIVPIQGYNGVYSNAKTLDGKSIIIGGTTPADGGAWMSGAFPSNDIMSAIGSGSLMNPEQLPYRNLEGDWRDYGGMYVAPAGSQLYDPYFDADEGSFFSEVISSPAFKALGLMAGAATGFGALAGEFGAGATAADVGSSAVGGSMDLSGLFSGLGDTSADWLSGATGWDYGPLSDTLLSGGVDAASGLTLDQMISYSPGLFESISNAASKMGISPTSIIKQIGSALTSGNTSALSSLSGLLGMGATGLGSYLAQQSSGDAAQTMADAQIKAAQIAADAAKFKPVGVTTRFGSSNFGYDANGNLTSAGYTLDPTIRAQQDKLLGLSGDYLNQYSGAIGATAPMGTAAQTMFSLGNSYLSTSPQEQAAKYMEEQNALLRPGNAAEYASLQNQLLQQGRLGLATGGEDGLMATNPELSAYQNKLEMQQRQLAAASTQGGMDYAKFGAGMVGSGGQMLQDMYGTQTAAYNPYKTALGGATYLEGLGQNALTQGIDLGKTATTASTNAGGLLASGITGAAQAMQPTNASNPWASFLGGVGNNLQTYGTPYSQPTQNAFQYDPYTGKLLGT